MAGCPFKDCRPMFKCHARCMWWGSGDRLDNESDNQLGGGEWRRLDGGECGEMEILRLWRCSCTRCCRGRRLHRCLCRAVDVSGGHLS